MLINGQEVNHLFLKGQQFDLKYAGKQCKLTRTVLNIGRFEKNGKLVYQSNGDPGFPMMQGNVYTILATYNNYFYLIISNITGIEQDQGWVSQDDVEILD